MLKTFTLILFSIFIGGVAMGADDFKIETPGGIILSQDVEECVVRDDEVNFIITPQKVQELKQKKIGWFEYGSTELTKTPWKIWLDGHILSELKYISLMSPQRTRSPFIVSHPGMNDESGFVQAVIGPGEKEQKIFSNLLKHFTHANKLASHWDEKTYSAWLNNGYKAESLKFEDGNMILTFGGLRPGKYQLSVYAVFNLQSEINREILARKEITLTKLKEDFKIENVKIPAGSKLCKIILYPVLSETERKGLGLFRETAVFKRLAL